MAAAQYFEQVQKIFIAFYQRPADPAGLKYWAQRVDAAGGNINEVINAFASSAEAVALYGAIDATTVRGVIDSLYTALFNVPADFDAAGKQFYVDGFVAGTFTAGTIALAVLNGAQNDDLIAVNNKVQVANNFTQQVDGRALTDAYFGTGTAFNVTYAGDTDAQAARDILKGVTFNAATVLNPSQVTDALKAQIANPGDVIIGQTGGQTFTLTTAVDNLTGTVGSDTFNADHTTLSAADILKGGAGIDTLNYTDARTTAVAGDKVPVAAVSEVEIINVRNVNGTAAVAPTAEKATVTFADVTVVGTNSTVTSPTSTIIIGGRTVTLTGNMSPDAGVSTGSNITFTAAQIASAFATSATGVMATPGVSATGTVGAYAVTSAGGNQVVFTSTGTGNVGDLTITGSGAPAQSIALVDGSAGTASNGASVEVVASNFLGATNFNSNLSLNAVDVTGMAAGQSAGLMGNGSLTNGALSAGYKAGVTAASINVSGGTKGGAVTVTGADLTATTVNSSGAANTVGNLTTVGTTLTVNAASNFTSTAGVANAALKTVTVTGAATTVNLGNVASTVLTTVDASGLTAGGIKLTTNAAVTSVKGGAGADAITLGAAAGANAVINLGAGNDSLKGTAALSTAAVADGGDGFDTISAALVNVGSAANVKNFEALDVTGFNAPLDAALLTNSTISALEFSGAAVGTGNTAIIQNVANAATVNVTGAIDQAAVQTANLGSLTLTQTGATPTLAVNFNAAPAVLGTTALPGGFFSSLGTLKFTGETALSIASGGNSFVVGNGISAVQDTGNTLKTITITGDHAFTLGAVNTYTAAAGLTATVASSLTTIDGSAATGKLNITAGANDTVSGQQLTYTGLTINGGSAIDTITIAAKNGVVNAGAGNDIINVAINAVGSLSDVVTVNGGAGADTLASTLAYGVVATAASSATTGNFVFFADAASTDIIKFATMDNASGTLGAKTTITGAATFDQAVFLAESAATNTVTWFQYAGNTYVQNSGATVGAGNSTDNIVIKLTGLVDLTNAVVDTTAETITFA